MKLKRNARRNATTAVYLPEGGQLSAKANPSLQIWRAAAPWFKTFRGETKKKTSCSHCLLCCFYTQTETTSLREARSQKNACCISAAVDLKIIKWHWNDCTTRHSGYLSQINERNACVLVRLAFSFISFILESLAKLKCQTEERLKHSDRTTEIRRVFNFNAM